MRAAVVQALIRGSPVNMAMFNVMVVSPSPQLAVHVKDLLVQQLETMNPVA